MQKRNIVATRPEYQPNKIYCGATCAEIILDKLGVHHTQKYLYKQNHKFHTIDRGKKWYSSPDGLQNTLNTHKPRKFKGEFELYSRKTNNSIARRMIWTIFNYREPCIASVKGGDHWVVVYGYEPPDAAPKSATDSSYKIKGLYLRDPLQTNAQRNIDYQTWKQNYAWPVDHGHWHKKFIAICDPDRRKKKTNKGVVSKIPKTNQNKTAADSMLMKSISIPEKGDIPFVNPNVNLKPEFIPESTFMRNPVNGAKIIDKNSAGNYALWVLKDRGFYQSKMLSMSMINPGPGDPVLVENLDRDDFYYLVPMKENGNQIYAIMIIAAKKANYHEASFAMYQNGPMEFAPLAENQIVSLLKPKYGAKELKKLKIYPALVWKTCNESFLPYLPFHKVSLGNRKMYIRIDGKIFKKLTPELSGF